MGIAAVPELHNSAYDHVLVDHRESLRHMLINLRHVEAFDLGHLNS